MRAANSRSVKSPPRWPRSSLIWLEAVDVDHDQRQRPAIAAGAGQLAVEKLEEVALVVDVGQGVDDGQAIDFLVILALDVAAREEAIDAVADAQIIAVLELVHRGRHVVDEGAVGALQIDGVVAVGAGLDAGMAARDGMVVDADVAIAARGRGPRAMSPRG